MLKNETIEIYGNLVDSRAPSPGGGSVAAVVGSLAICLARMYAHLSFEKKEYQLLDKREKNEFDTSFVALLATRKELECLIDEDAKIYDLVIKAYKLEKNTAEEALLRKQEIQKMTIKAIETPIRIAQACYHGLAELEDLLEHGNKRAITDAYSSAIFLFSAIEASLLNVDVNLTIIEDGSIKLYYENLEKKLLSEGAILKERIIQECKKYL